MFRRHNPHSHESYVGDRTHHAIEDFVANNVHDFDANEAVGEAQSEVGIGEGEGCVIRGVAMVNRVPGNFHISAHSKSHSFQPHTLNLSHSVTSMTFGKVMSSSQLRLLPSEVGAGYNGSQLRPENVRGPRVSLRHLTLTAVRASLAAAAACPDNTVAARRPPPAAPQGSRTASIEH